MVFMNFGCGKLTISAGQNLYFWKYNSHIMQRFHFLSCLFFLILPFSVFSQYKEYKIGPKGDTINAINKEGQKVGKWVTEVGEVRGEPGYVEEGIYKKGEKDGYFRRYTSIGDLLAVEHYKAGGKDGLQQYFTFLGELEHEENWKGYDPEDPYDTIPVYGTGSGEIIDYKIVKAEPYAVKNGTWRYFEQGRLLRTEEWSNNNLVNPMAPKQVYTKPEYKKPEKTVKTEDMLKWEKKRRNRKYVEGQTHL